MTLPIDKTLINSIIKAINKQSCKSLKSCYDCPFSMKFRWIEKCNMSDIPKEWNIKINVNIEDLDV